MNVLLSLVALIVKSERPSGNSANTTILALVGVELAVKVSETKVILVLETFRLLSATIIIPGPPSPPYAPPVGEEGLTFLPPAPPPPLFTAPGKPGNQFGC